MIENFAKKVVAAAQPQSVADNTTITGATIDTLGYEYAEFRVRIGISALAPTVLKVTQSDLSNMGSATDVLAYGTDTNDAGSTSTLPTATDDNKAFGFFIDLRGKKRYMNVVCTTPVSVNNTMLYAVECSLSRPHEAPQTALNAGYAQRLVG